MKMIALGLVVGLGVVGLVGARNLYYGGQVTYTTLRNQVSSRVPVEFKLEVAKKQLADELSKMEQSSRSLARLKVESKNQDEKVAKMETNMEREERRLTALRNQLPGGDTKFVSVGSAHQDEIAKDLADGLQSYTTDKELLESERAQAAELNNQMAVLEKAIDKRNAKISALKKSIVTLESRQTTVRLRNGGTSLPSDDNLNEIEELLQSLEDDVAVEEHLFEMRQSTNDSNVSKHKTEISAADAVSQFDALFCSEKK